MGFFEPVLILKEGPHYAARQGNDPLFRMPSEIFEAYEGDSVFPPLWSQHGDEAGKAAEPRYLLWHPQSGELLMSAIKTRPPLLAEVHGSFPFRAYLQAFFLPSQSRLLMRTYWNPEAPGESFDENARRESHRIQMEFLELVWRLMPPSSLTATLNAIERYQRLADLDGSGEEADKSKISRVYLAPSAKLALGVVQSALEALVADSAGRAYPTVDRYRLLWVETLGAEEMAEVRKWLDRFGLQNSDEIIKSH